MQTSPPKSDTPSWSSHFAATLRLGIPLVASQLAAVAYGVTDTIMLGWYGVEALAAGVLAAQVFFVFLLFGSGFAHAVAPLVAEALGADDEVKARRSLRMGFWVVTGFVIAVAPILWITEGLLLALGQDPDLSALAGGYMRIAMWNMFPVMAFFVLRSYFSALERAGVVMIATLAGIAINALLNYAFIFGNWGAPEMGVRGAAIATLGTGCLVLLAAMVQMWMDQELRRGAPLARLWRPDWMAMGEVFRLGLPISLMMLAETGLFSFTAIMMGWIGTVELAAHGIALQVITVMFMVPLGLMMAATARVGRAAGRGDPIAVWRASGAVMALAMGFSFVMAVVLVGLPETLVGVFLDVDKDRAPEILAFGAQLLVVAAAFQIVDVAQVLLAGVLRGVKDTTVPMIVAIVAYVFVGLSTCYLFGFIWDWGGVGIWWGMAASLLVAAIALGVRCIDVLRRRFPIAD